MYPILKVSVLNEDESISQLALLYRDIRYIAEGEKGCEIYCSYDGSRVMFICIEPFDLILKKWNSYLLNKFN